MILALLLGCLRWDLKSDQVPSRAASWSTLRRLKDDTHVILCGGRNLSVTPSRSHSLARFLCDEISRIENGWRREHEVVSEEDLASEGLIACLLRLFLGHGLIRNDIDVMYVLLKC